MRRRRMNNAQAQLNGNIFLNLRMQVQSHHVRSVIEDNCVSCTRRPPVQLQTWGPGAVVDEVGDQTEMHLCWPL